MIRAASLAALSLLAALVVACGGGAASGDADPASAVPANAMLYAEAVIQPEGDLREDALAATGKVLNTDDPEGKLREFIDKAFAESGDADLDYDKDIKPWLGERAALWLSTRLDDEGDPSGAAVIDVTSGDDAMGAIRRGVKDEGRTLTKRSHNGVDYEVDEESDVAVGVVDDDLLLIGAEPEVKASIDAQKGDSLAEADRYKKGVDALEDDRLAHFYMDLRTLFQLAMKSEPQGQDFQTFQQFFPIDKLPPIVGSFQANGERLALDVAVRGDSLKEMGPLAAGWTGGSTDLLKELPGDAWGAFGTPKYGEALKQTLNAYAGMLGGPAMKNQLQSQYGIDIDADVLDWIGDVAFFVRGDTLQNLDGAAVIQVTDSGKAERGFTKLVGLLQAAGGVKARPVNVDGADTAFSVSSPDLPKPIVLARSSERVVIAYGGEAAKAAFSPSEKLGDSELYSSATDALGEVDPSLLLSMPAVVKLVEASGSADPSFQQARPYLDAYDVIAYGIESGDDGGRFRVVAGLK
ncbi:MAG TPA: DUF3352 domain-containing protein [Solirubrobacteraceae bacterium]|nr:DUF3352 domain-containing protein [Solirubrobacteraceae bacterium]